MYEQVEVKDGDTTAATCTDPDMNVEDLDFGLDWGSLSKAPAYSGAGMPADRNWSAHSDMPDQLSHDSSEVDDSFPLLPMMSAPTAGLEHVAAEASIFVSTNGGTSSQATCCQQPSHTILATPQHLKRRRCQRTTPVAAARHVRDSQQRDLQPSVTLGRLSETLQIMCQPDALPELIWEAAKYFLQHLRCWMSGSKEIKRCPVCKYTTWLPVSKMVTGHFAPIVKDFGTEPNHFCLFDCLKGCFARGSCADSGVCCVTGTVCKMQSLLQDCHFDANWGLANHAKRRCTAPPSTLDDVIEDICSADTPRLTLPNEASHSGGLVSAPHRPTYWPIGSSNAQRHRGWSADPTPSGIQFTLPGLSSLLVPNQVPRPIQQHTLVLPPHSVPFDGAGNQSSEDISFLDKDDVMSLLATGGLGDEADSQQQAQGENEVEEIQPQVPYVVFVFLAKMRALVVRRRRHQHGAVADSLALDSCRKRMLERAVIARFATGGHANSIEGARSPSLDLLNFYGKSGCDLWDESGHQSDDRHLLDMAADYFC